ncbi:3-hydroxyisobutyryl-CoA hydrolase-like protein 3, mitochondrial [Pyrus communis]|uniref:3-hydroxyisobutyryl-CoA hydrolase-like protein 3, mitochondrial n=1 Tax=Pyrus communis TaxID=23211 RepID=UPI0035BF312D
MMDIQTTVTKFTTNPDSEVQLKSLLPQITSAFGANKSVLEAIDELKKQQQSSDAAGKFVNAICLLSGLYVAVKYFLSNCFYCSGEWAKKLFKVLERLTGVMKTEYCVAIRSSLWIDFAEGERAVLLDKDQNLKWNPSKLEEVNQSEVQAPFEPLSPNGGELMCD